MTLDPRERNSWQGLFDLLQPPTGYRLSAAIGTSFGLSIEGLTAALLAMSDADPETLASEPVAGVMAVTRLRSKVRMLVHPGTISSSMQGGSSRFVALLDRMILEVEPPAGLFHPKVWALRFDKVGPDRAADPASQGRLVVSSRNLSSSTAFELGTVLEGRPAEGTRQGSAFSGDVADALMAWLRVGKLRVPADVWQLPAFVRRLELDVPSEAADELRLRWQGQGRRPLAQGLPRRLGRALVVSPFLRPEFVTDLLDRTPQVQLVSTRESLDELDDATMARLDAARVSQGTSALYHVTELGEPDDGYIDGVHAKLVLVEDPQGRSTTFVGSANGTGPGWGLGGPMNVEAMVEMAPGIGIDEFSRAFIRESKTKVHPWIREYDRSAQTEPDETLKAERRLLAALRQAATLDFVLTYDAAARRLRLAVTPTKRGASTTKSADDGPVFAAAPLLLSDAPTAWTPLPELSGSPRVFDDVDIDKVTAFVVLRARSREMNLERSRLVIARLEMLEEDLDRRDDAVRREIMAQADPAAVLNALVKGLSYLGAPGSHRDRNRRPSGKSLRQVLGEATLERLLQAVALQPDLVDEIRLLLAGLGDLTLQALCEDLEAVLQQIRSEAAS